MNRHVGNTSEHSDRRVEEISERMLATVDRLEQLALRLESELDAVSEHQQSHA